MKKIGLNFLEDVNFISQLKGNNNYLSYVLSNVNSKEDKYDTNIYLYDLGNQVHRKLTSGNSDKDYFWLRENEIVFKSDRDKEDNEIPRSQFYKVNISGGEADLFLDMPYNIKALKMINANEFYFTAYSNQQLDQIKDLSGHKKDDYLHDLKAEKDYEVMEEIPFWNNGGSFSKGSRTALYYYNKNTEKVIKLTSEKFDLIDFKYENEFANLFVIGREFTDKLQVYNQLYKLDQDKQALTNISHSADYSYENLIQVNPESLMIYGSDMKAFGLNENGKFGLLHIEDKTYKCLTPDLKDSTSNGVGSDLRLGNLSSDYIKDDTGIYFTILEAFTNKFMHLSYDGRLSEYKNTRACVDEYVKVKDQIFYIGLKDNAPQEIYCLDTAGAISAHNQDIVKTYKISRPQHVTFKNRAGLDIDGFYIKPADFADHKKYPVILNIHGGPKAAYGDVLYHEMQYWSSEGYGVIYCNPRGSDGKGSVFADIRGQYGQIDYQDIMDFVDFMLSQYTWMDDSRLAVTGGSYGGFMTNWIIGHTTRFKVAVSQRSISNWISFFGTSDIGYFFASDQVQATPWQNYDSMWDQSPLKYADKVKTPTLFIHSKNDYRCWTPEAYQMFTALKYFGVASKLVLFDGENHELSRSGKPKHRVRRLKEITEWIGNYINA